MLSVLIIDDVEDAATVISEAINKGIPNVECKIETDFERGIVVIETLKPHVIVLDLMQGIQSSEFPGEKTWKSIWEGHFCPIVIYSGTEADLDPPVPDAHPFVKRIKKGDGRVADVVEALKGFEPAVEAIKLLHVELNAVINKVLRDTAGNGVIPTNEPTHLLHAGRRRIAAEMDNQTLTGQREMMSWEQYLVPAIGESPLTADVLRLRGSDSDNPSAFRLLLTPSCDLVTGRCESTVLVAKCEPVDDMIRKLSLSPKPSEFEKSAKSVRTKTLTTGVFEGYVPIPAFGTLIPIMVANMKNLEVIPHVAIGREDDTQPSYDRIASIDSPFREQVAWAYLTTAARPGMPERDLMPWAREILGTPTPSEQNEGDNSETK